MKKSVAKKPALHSILANDPEPAERAGIQHRPATPKASKTSSPKKTHKSPLSEHDLLDAIRAEAKQTLGGRIRLKKFLANEKRASGWAPMIGISLVRVSHASNKRAVA